jgi:hypothetical protein
MTREMDADHLGRVLARQGDEPLNRRLSQAPGAFRGSPSDSLTSAEGGVVSEPYETPFLLAAEMERYNASHPDGGRVGEHPGEAELVRQYLECTGARHTDDTDSGVVRDGRYVVAPSAARRHGQYVAVPGPDGRLRAVPRPALAQQPAAVNLAQPARSLTEAEQADREYRNAQAAGLFLPEDARARIYGPGGDPAAEMTAGWDD